MKENDLVLPLDAVKEMNKQLETLDKNYKIIFSEDLFFSIQDVIRITNWSKKTVEDLFNNPAFPATDFGKKKLVLKSAFIEFFSVKRCRADKDYWK